MSFQVKDPAVAASQAGANDRQSTYREAEAVPIGYGANLYPSHWITQQFSWRKVRAGQMGEWNFYSIAASYGIGPIDYVGRIWEDGKEIYTLGYWFEPGETEHTFTINPGLAGSSHNFGVTIYRGAETQNPSAALSAATGQNHPRYKGKVIAIWHNAVAGINQTAARQFTIELGRRTPQIGDFGPTLDLRYGVNPIAAIYGLLRESKGGLAAKDAILNPAHWGAQAAALEAIGVGQRTGAMLYCHPHYTSAQEVGALVSEILGYFGGYIYEDAGELKIGWYPNQPLSLAGVPEISEADLDAKPGGTGFEDWNAGATSAVVVFKDTDRKMTDRPARYQAPVNSRNSTAAKAVRKERPFIHAFEQARVIAAEVGAEGNAGDSGATLSVFKSRLVHDSSPIMPGTLINWDYAPHNLDLACRIVERRLRFGSASDTIKVIRERGAFPRPYVAAADERVLPTLDEPGDIATGDVRLWLMPPGFGYAGRRVAVLLNRGKPSIVRAEISLSSAGAPPWSEVHEQNFFAAKCTVNVAINAAATTVRIATASVDFAEMAAQDPIAQQDDTLLLLIGDEVMSVGDITAVSAGVYDLSILRGRRRTTAAAHAVSDVAWLVKRAEIQPIAHEEFARVTSGGVYHLATATKYFKVRLATPDAEGSAKPDDPGLSLVMPNIAPSGLTLTSGSATAIIGPDGFVLPRLLITWNAPTDQAFRAAGKTRIQLSYNNVNWLDWALVSGDQEALAIVGLAIGQNHYIRLRSELDIESEWVTAGPHEMAGDTDGPAALSGVTATAYPGFIRVEWPASTAADIGEYKVFRGTSTSFGSASEIGETPGLTWDDPNVTAGITYRYWVVPRDRSENGAVSASNRADAAAIAAPLGDTTPSNPSAASKTGEGNYVTGDGTVLSYLQFSVPALPSGAVRQILLYRRNVSGEFMIAAQLTNTSSATIRIDDLSPGVVYQVATQAWSASRGSSVVSATSSPFTAPASSTPNTPTGLSMSTSSTDMARVPVAWAFGGGKYPAGLLKWTASTSVDVAYYEIRRFSAIPAIIGRTRGTETEFPIYSVNVNYVSGEDLNVRAVNRLGTPSAWSGGIFPFTLTANYGPGSLADQNADAAVLSGVKTGAAGASSVRQIRAIHPGLDAVPSFSGGGTTETFSVSLTGLGFGATPDIAFATCMDPVGSMVADYQVFHAANSSTLIHFVARMRDGSVISAGARRFGIYVVEYA